MKSHANKNALHTTLSHYGYSTVVAVVLCISIGIALIGIGIASILAEPRYISAQSSADVEPVINGDNQHLKSLGYSRPTYISVPAIEIESPLIDLGKRNDGTLEVPEGADTNMPSWFNQSPAPGQIGTSVIIGHVDQLDGQPSIFFRLGELKLNDRIDIQREDGSNVSFIVVDKKKIPKKDFPSNEVYAPSSSSSLRLITCGGEYDSTVSDYDSNIIIYAERVDDAKDMQI